MNHLCRLRQLVEDCFIGLCQDRSGLSPLHRAAQRGSTASASVLLEAGANLEEPALYDGATPLLMAAAEGQEVFAR